VEDEHFAEAVALQAVRQARVAPADQHRVRPPEQRRQRRGATRDEQQQQ